MSDNSLPQHMGMLGFAEQPEIDDDGYGPIPLRQRWFDFHDGQFHHAVTVGPNLESGPGPSHERNIRFITLVIGDLGYNTEMLAASISGSDMDRLATVVAEMVSADLADGGLNYRNGQQGAEIRDDSFGHAIETTDHPIVQNKIQKQGNSAMADVAVAAVIVGGAAVVVFWLIRFTIAMGESLHHAVVV
ncbi:hypothetical protein KVR01_007880 [Diaporthe batatas]|uniref:uncharacterized protein n=1 Tax=Diaporthe batatas TaxID=748121 RepID=UPI001D03C1C1|nr:uncharacterized protein KVR01_007880 [Diaporthe batatas]KAG8162115.1 hypothetical protein KVR01_007880 [Diaporthe batatas]